MSEIFFRQLRIPEPDINLGSGSGSHGQQTGRMLAAIEKVLLEKKPDAVLVYGDTNSTLAGALAASKLNLPVAHVEAGLRSFERSMPEEQNRVLTDHLSSFLFCPTETARENLRREGITKGVWNAGDVMYDASLFYRNLVREDRTALTLPPNLPGEFYLLTVHRAENTDDPQRLSAIVQALNSLPAFPAVFPAHPRTRLALQRYGLKLQPHIRTIAPVGFLEMLALEETCRFIVTDSGGVQKEAFFFRKPCITLRDQTEWVETVESGWNVLAGADPQRIRTAFHSLRVPDQVPDLYGAGEAAVRILKILTAPMPENRPR
jgi:UDP-GlcNAc3NAcA epimerase